MPDRKLVITKDGSHTVYDTDRKSNFHSIHGAITESNHVFIEHGLNYLNKYKSEIKIFELGFGTGLNAFLSYLYSKKHSLSIIYHAIDLFPLSFDIVASLNYPNLLEVQNEANSFAELHRSKWNIEFDLNNLFQLQKIDEDWNTFSSNNRYDLIYFDAFDPISQPDLWTTDSFIKTYEMMNAASILCTYCAKGSVKRSLKDAGFKIESLQGPPGKREMTRAHKL